MESNTNNNSRHNNQLKNRQSRVQKDLKKNLKQPTALGHNPSDRITISWKKTWKMSSSSLSFEKAANN